MGLAPWVRERLWRADSWCGELALMRKEIGAASSERLFDLATAIEQCDPDRGRALTVYLDAWRAGHDGARERARSLATALRAHMTLAEMALSAGELVVAGAAYLDAGFPELAAEPLQKFVDARPPGASPATENVRLDGVRVLLAFAVRNRVDAEREIADSLARAQHATGRAAAAAYVHAARIAKLANLDDRLGSILAAASRACPDDDAVALLVETRLLETGNVDQLVEHYRARFDRAPSRAEYVERVRTAATELIARNLQPGLGLRLLRMCLEHAYGEQLAIRSHIAAWELLSTHARVQHSTLELVPLIVRAIASPLGEDDALYLARLGLEIAWRDAGDTQAAQPYAATVLDFVPDHPLASAFASQLAPAHAPAPAPPVAAVAPPKTTSRIPVIDQGPVKRVEAPGSPLAKDRGVTGRLALLKPPPPRATSLRRDSSPFPISPVPAKPPTPRAARKVVPIDVVVELPNGSFFSTLLRDVSTTGAFIVTKRVLEIDSIVALELRVPTPGTVKLTSFRANARIARRTDIGYGLAFVDAARELVAALRTATEGD